MPKVYSPAWPESHMQAFIRQRIIINTNRWKSAHRKSNNVTINIITVLSLIKDTNSKHKLTKFLKLIIVSK